MALVNSSNTQVAAYTYDPWGRVLTATGSMAAINPLRYRGYYQDSETGFYYLQSRYYDPAIRRFLNADGYASTGQGILGHNMFAYCRNNPTSRADTSGNTDKEAMDVDGNPSIDEDDATGANPSGGSGGGSNGYTYTAPAGGGGTTHSITIDHITITFGHGGRHLGGVDISGLENAIANHVVNQSVNSTKMTPFTTAYDGQYYTYRAFQLADDRIHVGTYFIQKMP